MFFKDELGEVRTKEELVVRQLAVIQLVNMYKQSNCDRSKEEILESVAIITAFRIKDYKNIICNKLMLIGENEKEFEFDIARILSWIVRISDNKDILMNSNLVYLDEGEYKALLPKGIDEKYVRDIINVAINKII